MTTVHESSAASFTGLVDLAAATLGGRAVATSDDFFAPMDNLLLPGRGEFIPGKYTDRGKWMDGWESRRKRDLGAKDAAGNAHDWCIVELGAPGHVLGIDIDTNHFSGNHPPFASLDGLRARPGTPAAALEALPWRALLPQVPLRPSAQNLFAAATGAAGGGAGTGTPISHVRLNIFPDGGVARLRVFGRVVPSWEPAQPDAETQAHLARLVAPAGPAGATGAGSVHDLAAVTNGGSALCCSDAFFGPMNNILLPGRAADMGGGWETRRKRGPGHDWLIVELGARGIADLVEVDTNHFKGNFPEGVSLDGIDAAGARMTELIASSGWAPLLEQTRLSPHARHFFRGDALRPHRAMSHVRINIFPDGGLSRFRLWGRRDA
jgi:allantoicase